jgi:hypothetical protein
MRAVGAADFLVGSARVLLRFGDFEVAADVCAPPELETVTPGETSTVDDDGD